MKRVNYHTHTIRCKHAHSSDEDYVKNAIKAGYEVLGFSDHTPWRYESSFVPYMRMSENELEGYIDSIRSLKKKYQAKIDIKIGLEAEYFPKYMDYLKEIINKYELDYVIFGNHYYLTDELDMYFGMGMDDKDAINTYVDYAIEGLETGIYAYFAHPDIFLREYDKMDEKALNGCERICKYAKEHNIILEYNLAGLRYSKRQNREAYPRKEFWEIAGKYKCKAIVGVDAHDSKHLLDTDLYDESKKLLKKLGCIVVDTIPLRR